MLVLTRFGFYNIHAIEGGNYGLFLQLILKGLSDGLRRDTGDRN